MRTDRRGPLLDTLPELFVYRDDGCEASPSCLRCPLPICRYDNPGWVARARREQRHSEARRLAAQVGIAEAARLTGYSTRTVFRVLARA